jgi:hypothetical protein
MSETLPTVTSGNPAWLTELLDDRDKLIEQLTTYTVSPRQEVLVHFLIEGGKVKKKEDIRTILGKIPMSMPEFFAIVREIRAGLSKFRADEMLDVYRPQVVEAVMQGALPVDKVCDTCFGSGQIPAKKDFRDCWKCAGTGKLVVQPEHARQITALKISGVLERENPNTVVNVNNAMNGSWRSSPDFRKETDKIMYATVIDVKEEKALEPVVQALPENSAASVVTAMDLPVLTVAPEKTPVVLGKPLGKRKEEKSVQPKSGKHTKAKI